MAHPPSRIAAVLIAVIALTLAGCTGVVATPTPTSTSVPASLEATPGATATAEPTLQPTRRPALPPSGAIVFTGIAPTASVSAIDLMQVGGSVITTLTDNGGSPAWSPDGTSIVFTRRSEIWVMNADGSDPRDIHHVAHFNEESPVWSPDGRQIAFLESAECGLCGIGMTAALTVMNADGSTARKVTDVSYSNQIAWLPDGKGLVFGGSWEDPPTPANGLQVIGLDGSGQHQLTTGRDSFPAISRDGRLAFVRDTSEAADGTILFSIFVANIDGSAQRQVPLHFVGGPPLAWSPDGAWIAIGGIASLERLQTGPWDIWLVSTLGLDAVNLTNGLGQGAGFPSWR